MIVAGSPMETRDTPVARDIQISNPNVKELHDVLTNNVWQKCFIETQTLVQQEAIGNFRTAIEREAKKTAGIELGKEGIQDKAARTQRFQELLGEVQSKLKAEKEEKLKALHDSLTDAQNRSSQSLANLIEAVESRKDDSELIKVLAVWGRSPNHANERGSDDGGFNAGVIHFFEYRAFPDKLGHNRQDNMSLDGFINRSQAVDSLVNSPETVKPVISKSHTLRDETGKQARYLLTNAGELVIAYKEAGTERFKVVTVISGQNIQALDKRVNEEIKNPFEQRAKRLNHLGSGVQQV